MQDVNALVTLQISLARIEETLKPLAALVQTVAEVKDVSREALLSAHQANQKLELLEPAVSRAQEAAEEALRNAATAMEKLNTQDENRKWVRRSFYGPLISSIAAVLSAAILAYIGLSGR
ncbi:putative nucleic acid-binding Zn-ribbon protein [Paenibacillus shirakamiensis]|uniref:Nucleic acid-binding Zn-ribbon protein n=2 Tax=Paenibacillus shirakamiensis TaxID=1265935 RepID=A0ABS4JLG8_9BACL|nr:putative nucleic acid-binding Zn-ribbon protein [Paenibacillus shirakamiensis]